MKSTNFSRNEASREAYSAKDIESRQPPTLVVTGRQCRQSSTRSLGLGSLHALPYMPYARNRKRNGEEDRSGFVGGIEPDAPLDCQLLSESDP